MKRRNVLLAALAGLVTWPVQLWARQQEAPTWRRNPWNGELPARPSTAQACTLHTQRLEWIFAGRYYVIRYREGVDHDVWPNIDDVSWYLQISVYDDCHAASMSELQLANREPVEQHERYVPQEWQKSIELLQYYREIARNSDYVKQWINNLIPQIAMFGGKDALEHYLPRGTTG